MRTRFLALACAAGLWTAAPPVADAGPLTGAGLPSAQNATAPLEDARLFCYNRSNGRFLHWGGCGYNPVSHPRVYCRNTYTGQFLHWGSCY